MNHYYLIVLGICACFLKPEITYAQNLSSPCGADYWRAQTLKDPDFIQKNQAFEQSVLHVFEQKKTGTGVPEQTKTIPVVLHIIHDGGPENISDAQAQQAIAWLNQALANQGSFGQGSGADCGIQLCLAQRSPNNQPTTGITRNQSALTEMQMESQDLAVKNLNRWKTSDYVNIWLVRSICSTTYGCGVYGYANYPFAHGSNIDGIVIEASYLTQITKITGLAHEMGHYLGLYHTFEGGCSNNNCLLDGDRICDTPPDQSTAGVPCGDQLSTCATDIQSGPFSTDQPDMSWNFLDYGIIACFHDYTPDQATRMNATLDGIRKSLLSSKGCLPPCPGNTLANFNASATSIPVGQTVNFTNTSQNAGSYTWTLDGVPFSTQASPAYTFTMPGTYSVVLTAQPNNPSLCDASTKQMTIIVVCDITASFSISNLSPETDQTIFLSNTSQNTLQSEWFVNGLSQGPTLDSIVFAAPGVYEIQLKTSNGVCLDSVAEVVYVSVACVQKSFEYKVKGSSSTIYGTVLKDGNILFWLQYIPTPLLAKITPNGKIIWSKKIDEAFWQGSILPLDYDICAAADGGFFLQLSVGFFPIDTSAKYLAKFTTDGNLEWAEKIYGSITSADNIVLTTLKDGSVVSNYPSLSRFSQNGNWLWSKFHQATVIKPYPDGGFLTLNVFSGCEISRFDVNGNLLWKKTTNSFIIKDLLAMPNGDIYLTGSAQTPPFNVMQAILIKMTAEGDTVWCKKYRQIPVSNGDFTQMTPSENGNIILLGHANVDDPGPFGLQPYRIMIEVNLEGEVQWSSHYKTLYGSESLEAVPTGGYLITTTEAEIIRTNQIGQTIGCPEVPHEVNVDPFSLGFDDITQVASDSSYSLEPALIPLVDYPFIVDTICAPTCFQTFEICNNNLDDDGDGLFDCLDPDCNCSEFKCAPKQGNRWYFGNHAGLDFNTDPPSVLGNGGYTAQGICAAISDVKGNLLLYTDGDTVFNRFDQPMPNGILPANSLAYQCQIVPHPDNSSLYYVLVSYLDGFNPLNRRFYYSVVDMSLDNGRGDIGATQKHQLLTTGASGLAVVQACSFKGYWILSRTIGQTSKFRAFRLDENGLNLTPVESNSGQDVNAIRQLKISPDGKHVACTYQSALNQDSSFVSIYNFDPYNSGVVSNPVIIGGYKGLNKAVGVEFSPNGRFLYVSGSFPGNVQLQQFDLEAGNLTAIQNSKVKLANLPGQTIGPLQLAPDRKIYAPSLLNINPIGFLLEIIKKPDEPGLSCQFEHQGFDLLTNFQYNDVWEGLCNIISSNLGTPHIVFPLNAPDTICLLNSPIQYQIPSVQCGIDSIVWQTQNLSAQIQPNYQYASIRYLEPGAGRLIVTAYTACGISSDTLNILVAAPIDHILNLGPDLVVCQNGVFSFNAGSGFARYQWSDGTADSTTTTLFPGKYWVTAWDVCGNAQSDTIIVSIAPNSVLDLGPDLPQQCSGFSAAYQRPAIFESWKWSPNDFLNCTDCPNVLLSPATSITWTVVAQTADGCISVDTLKATIRDTLLFSLDTIVCLGEQINIHGVLLPPDTSAQFLFPAGGAGCDTLLNVHVLGVENASAALSTTICPNDFYEFNGVLLPADTVAMFHFPSSNHCDSVVTVKVNAFPSLHLSMPMDTSIQIGASVLLETSANSTGALDFVWSPLDGLSCSSCPDPIAGPLDTITYSLEVTDINGCTTTGSVTVRVNDLCRVRVPNVFTPNGDGANDLFRPIMDPCVRNVRLWRILNRWGQTVLTQINIPPNDPLLGWDGMVDGKPQASDVLIWIAEFEYFDGRQERRQGEVTLIR